VPAPQYGTFAPQSDWQQRVYQAIMSRVVAPGIDNTAWANLNYMPQWINTTPDNPYTYPSSCASVASQCSNINVPFETLTPSTPPTPAPAPKPNKSSWDIILPAAAVGVVFALYLSSR
jgi:hypothetical protein